MSEAACRSFSIDSACSPEYQPLQRKPSMMKRLRKSFRRAVSNREAESSVSRLDHASLRPSVSAEVLHSQAFSSESYDTRPISDHMFRATTMWDNLVTYLEANVKPGTRRRSLKIYTNCFFGHEAVDCLHKYITTDLSRQCDREQVNILCHRFLMLGIIEDAKCATETERDFSMGMVYRLTEKKFWEFADERHHESQQVSESPTSHTKKLHADIVDSIDSSEKMQRRNIKQIFKPQSSDDNRTSVELTTATIETLADSEVDGNDEQLMVPAKQCSPASPDIRSIALHNDSLCSDGSSKMADHSETLPQVRKRRWHSIKGKSYKLKAKKTQPIQTTASNEQEKNDMQNSPNNETDQPWIMYGYV